MAEAVSVDKITTLDNLSIDAGILVPGSRKKDFGDGETSRTFQNAPTRNIILEVCGRNLLVQDPKLPQAYSPMVFNKRLYSSQTTVVITHLAAEVMRQNASRLSRSFLGDTRTVIREQNEINNNDSKSTRSTLENQQESRCSDLPPLSKSDLFAMRSVVDGLNLIHKNRDYIKDCLSQVITEEVYSSSVYLEKQTYESSFSCYYVISGTLSVIYGRSEKDGGRPNVYQENIVYNHGPGEYIGIVSAEDPGDDMLPPLKMFVKEDCRLLRIDRIAFHHILAKVRGRLNNEKRQFIDRKVSVLSEMPEEAKPKVIPLLLKRNFPANRAIMKQGASSDSAYIVISGRAVATRTIYVPETYTRVSFHLRYFEPGCVFGEECILANESAYCDVTTITTMECYSVPRSAIEIVGRNALRGLIKNQRNVYPQDDALRSAGYQHAVWNLYKRSVVVSCLKQANGEKLLSVAWENYWRFIEKGSKMAPVRRHSVVINQPRNRKLLEKSVRPHTGSRTNRPTERRMMDRLRSPLEKKRDGDEQTLSGDDHSDKTEPGEDDLATRADWPDKNTGDRHFIENGVFATMQSDEIIKKAKAVLDAFGLGSGATARTDEEPSGFLAENKHAQTVVATCRLRSAVLSRKLLKLDAQRPEQKRRSRPHEVQSKQTGSANERVSEPLIVESKTSPGLW